MNMMRGQVTLEFIVVTAIVMVVFAVMLQVIANERKLASQSIWSLDAADAAQRLANGLDSAYIAGDGATMNVTLPRRLYGGVNYSITVRRRMVTVEVTPYNRTFDWKFSGGGVEGSSGGLSVEPGTVGLRNENGTIQIMSYGG